MGLSVAAIKRIQFPTLLDSGNAEILIFEEKSDRVGIQNPTARQEE